MLQFINPAKWVNTRTHDQAMLYSQFRPLTLKINYIPVCGTNTPGSLSFGAIYNSSYPTYTDDLYLRLPQFEGGFITSVWNPAQSFITCKSKLLQNQFALSHVSDQDIPITIMAIFEGIPKDVNRFGYFAITGTYALSGPRMSPEETSVSGTATNAPVSASSEQVVLDWTPTQGQNFKAGDTFSALVTGINEGNTNGVSLGINWKHVFKVFKNIVCTVISIAEKVLKVAVAVAPILLGSINTNNLTATGISLSFEVLGRSDFQ